MSTCTATWKCSRSVRLVSDFGKGEGTGLDVRDSRITNPRHASELFTCPRFTRWSFDWKMSGPRHGVLLSDRTLEHVARDAYRGGAANMCGGSAGYALGGPARSTAVPALRRVRCNMRSA